MKLRELFMGQDVTIDGDDVEVTALVYDSRKLVPGCLFAAMPGQRRDGHEYIAEAVARGATAILCERGVDTGPAARVRAKDARVALAVATKRFFGAPSDALVMVGVTGTNGKTTTTHLVQAVLEAAGMGTGIIGTLGSKLAGKVEETGLTTPESVELAETLAHMRRAGARAVAMEVSSHALAQGRVAGVEFDVAVFTNLTHDHLDFHGTLDEYFSAKRRLFTERLKPAGRAVLNFDDERVRTLADGKTLTFSAAGDSRAHVRVVATDLSLAGTKLRVATPAGNVELRSPLVGRFNVENVLAAASVGLALGLDPAVIAAGVATMAAVPGRLERVSSDGEPLVAVDYAHTPDALEKALKVLREVVPGRLICVFGCGGDRDAQKRAPMGQVAGKYADYSIITSDNPRSEDPLTIIRAIERGVVDVGATSSKVLRARGYTVELERGAAIELALRAAQPGDGVLIAGKGHETYQLIGAERLAFDDRKVAREVLKKLSPAVVASSTTGGPNG